MDALPRGEVIGIVLGAVVLFSIISIIPILIMRHHRRNAHTHTAEEAASPPMYQTTTERWIAEQHIRSDIEHCADDLCPICLCALSSPRLPLRPEPARLSGQGNFSSASSEESGSNDNEIIVLSRCNHAFHLACLTSWFEYRRYRCPICQTSYSPVKAPRT